MRRPALLLSVATIALAAPAFAQDVPPTATPTNGAEIGQAAEAQPAADETGNQGDIIVTATRRSERLSNVPIAVSAVGQEALQNSGGRTSVRSTSWHRRC